MGTVNLGQQTTAAQLARDLRRAGFAGWTNAALAAHWPEIRLREAIRDFLASKYQDGTSHPADVPACALREAAGVTYPGPTLTDPDEATPSLTEDGMIDRQHIDKLYEPLTADELTTCWRWSAATSHGRAATIPPR